MSDTCIVCLGDLGEGASDPTLAVDSLPRPTSGDGIAEDVTALLSQTPDRESQYIAHLIPCGHNLHNECLKPWVERANSCPICRQKFNVVELAEHLGGSVISSYAVEDRVQVAEIDPTLIIDDLVEDSDSQPCPICGDDDNEDLLLLCDGCDTASHTYCVGLDSVPSGPWFCCHCEGHRPLQSEPSRPRNRSSRRTRADVRRTRTRNQIQALHWARVWQSVWDHLNLDLDFPFDDEQAADRIIQQRRREAANRREFRTWKDDSGSLATPTTTRLDNASDLLEIEELAELLERGESSRAARPVNSAGSPSAESGPTFLQSLLKEVEDSSGPHRINGTLPNANVPCQCVDSTSPGPSSPALSPTSSNRSSPHPSSYTSPQLTNGPTTPISSTSDAALSSPEFSPSCSPARDAAGVDQTRLSRQLRRLQPRRDNNDSSSPSRLRSIESSPTRSELSLHVKSDLQKIVRAALKPHYRKHLVTKEEYTEINKRISRMLYEFAASKESGDPMDAESKARWAHIANNEVMKAVQRIQELKSNEASDSSGAASS
ncbi:hypothetical protein CISG_06895 [Coccidioides immitis RMSCC 3703]|uniref:PHD and RING finger domain-containing protein n=1 Tax=Coccidioides immitis RMSCC 3703 TaxID=454286 RepID=A0A0J8QZS3_COCIT|nr:hypothetical protein CISG_06895 [Coccidioides immitis RMSCC 3703]